MSALVPWFEVHPRRTLVLVGAMFVAVFLLRLRVGTVDDATAMLYLFPVSLCAISRGQVAGILAGLLAVALTATWVAANDVNLSALGWTARVLPLVALGFLIGRGADSVRGSEKLRVRARAAELQRQQAVRINDDLVQGMSAAKWMLEMGRTEAGIATLASTVEQGLQLVSELMRADDRAPESPTPD